MIFIKFFIIIFIFLLIKFFNEIFKEKISIEENIFQKLKNFSSLSLDKFKNIDITEIITLINDILKSENFIRSLPSFLEFIEISSFGDELITEGNIPKEGYILKKSQRKRYGCFLNSLTFGLINCCNFWQKRWFILQDEMICYLENSTSNLGKDVK